MLEFIGQFFTTILYQPLLNLLVALYNIFGQNLGLAIISMTVVLKLITYPLTKPSIEFARKQKEIAPKIAELKAKYKNQQVFAQKQMELYKEHGINPALGCLPLIIQVVIFGFLYTVFRDLLGSNGVVTDQIYSLLYPFQITQLPAGVPLNTQFLIWNLAAVDKTYILPTLSALSQYVASRYTAMVNKPVEGLVKKTPDVKDDVMYNVQQASTYTLPIVTFFIGVTLPSGLSLYWLCSTLLGLLQTWLVNSKVLKNSFKKSESNGSREITKQN